VANLAWGGDGIAVGVGRAWPRTMDQETRISNAKRKKEWKKGEGGE